MNWPTAFWPITREPELDRFRNGAEISISIIAFILDYFGVKLMKTFYKKSKKNYFNAILDPFSSRQKWILLEKRFRKFLNIPTIYHQANNLKKIMSHSWEKCWTERRMDRRTDRQWFYRTLRRAGVQLVEQTFC